MIDKGLITTCRAKADELDLDCFKICKLSEDGTQYDPPKNTGCDAGFTHIGDFDTKLFGEQLATGPDIRYYNNRFMQHCCVRNDGAEWNWDSSATT